MGIRNTVEIICDYSECKAGQNGEPVVYSWCKDDVESGKAQAPPEAQYLVIFNEGGVTKSFCGQLHAAMHFLPPGYEIERTPVVDISTRKPVEPWTEPSPDNGQEGQ